MNSSNKVKNRSYMKANKALQSCPSPKQLNPEIYSHKAKVNDFHLIFMIILKSFILLSCTNILLDFIKSLVMLELNKILS